MTLMQIKADTTMPGNEAAWQAPRPVHQPNLIFELNDTSGHMPYTCRQLANGHSVMSIEISTMKRLTDILGGSRVLHRSLHDEFDLHAMVMEGLPVKSLMNMVDEAYMTNIEADAIVVKNRTLRRRYATAAPLTPSESERMARIARLYAQAETVFDNSEKAKAWMHRPNRALQNERPLDMARTDSGARLVETALDRIAWGDYS